MKHILITNFAIRGNSGTEMYTRDLSKALLRRGWRVSVYSPNLGPLAEDLRGEGVDVHDHPGKLTQAPDLIHGHHNLPLLSALTAWPETLGLFVCHDSYFWHDHALLHPRIRVWAGVDTLCRERVARDANLPFSQVAWIGNGVDLNRFTRVSEPSGSLRRALVFSNYATADNFLPVIEEACRRLNIELDIAGSGAGIGVDQPEAILAGYDLVFGKARCAMEALASGCTVLLLGLEGMGPLVTLENFAQLRAMNFGRMSLTETLTVDGLMHRIQGFNPAQARPLAAMAREILNWEKVVEQWVRVYEFILNEPYPSVDFRDEQKALCDAMVFLAHPMLDLYELGSLRATNQRLQRSLDDLQAESGPKK